jgi:hypothetical protein
LAYRVTLRIRSLNGLAVLFSALDRLLQHYGSSEPWLDVVRIETERRRRRKRRQPNNSSRAVAKLFAANARQPRIGST